MGSKRKRTDAAKARQRGAASPASRASASGDRLRPWLLAGACALLVARPLFPSEASADRGDGLPLVMLWLALAVFWLLGVIGRPRFPIRFGWTDAALGLLILLHTIAALYGAARGAPRPAINMLWQWVAYGVGFFLLRQLIAGPKETRAVLAVMVALAVGLAGHGLYQYYYEMPATVVEYERDKDKALRDANLWFPEGSPERLLFENRLHSKEPAASFALANSLAGYLAPWLVVAAGIWIGGRRQSPLPLGGSNQPLPPLGEGRGEGSGQARGNPPRLNQRGSLPDRHPWFFWSATAVCLVGIADCLLLTKSRSGYLATLAGMALVVLFCRNRYVRIGWKVPLAGAVVLAGLIAWAVAVLGGLDVQVLTEATKSLGYRGQYWRASLALIADHPLLGCGPGNFQNDYMAYKLPEASEEIADPHNFLFEVWATAGTPALLALVAVLGSFAFAVMRPEPRVGPSAEGPAPNALQATGSGGFFGQGVGNVEKPSAEKDSRPLSLEGEGAEHDRQPDRPVFVVAGLFAGYFLGSAAGLVAEAPPGMAVIGVGLPLAGVTIALLWPWIVRGRLPAALPAIGILVLLVNLLAAGALGFPGVAGTLWVLMAVGLNQRQRASPRMLPRAAGLAGLVFAMALAVACYATAYGPVLEAQQSLRMAPANPARAVELLERAAARDRLSAEPWVQLSRITFDQWEAAHSRAAMERLEHSTAMMLRLAPNASHLWLAAGDRYRAVFAKTGQREMIEKAISTYRRAVQLYPNSGVCRAKLAVALADAGDERGFRAEADQALRLDSLTPHVDKKLPPELRKPLLRNSPRAQ